MANTRQNPAISRRTMLEVLGAGAAAPLLSWPTTARANLPYPKRLVILYTQEGLIPKLMIPNIPTGPLSALTPTLSPLEPFRSKINIVGGLAMLSCIDQPWEGKPFVSAHSGNIHLLTGSVCEGPGIHPTLGYKQPAAAGGPSVDQFVAARLAKETPYPSLLFGHRLAGKNDGPGRLLAFTGKGHAGIEPENDPKAAFDRLFGSQGQEGLRLAKEQRSVLDNARRRLERTQMLLGQADKQKLDHHLTSIRELETRLNHEATCAAQEWDSVVTQSQGHKSPVSGISHLIEIGKLALACDLTRVLSIQVGSASGNSMGMGHVLLDGKPIDHNEHEVSHTGSIDRRPEKQAACTKWKASVYADLLAALDSVKEGEGTLLDHSLVVWVSQMATPWDHAMAPFTTVTAGSCGGALKTGQFLTYGEPLALKTRASDSGRVDNAAYSPHNRLLISICHAMGFSDVNSFGTEKYNAGGRLEGLHV